MAQKLTGGQAKEFDPAQSRAPRLDRGRPPDLTADGARWRAGSYISRQGGE
jgi:hypothetical protein